MVGQPHNKVMFDLEGIWNKIVEIYTTLLKSIIHNLAQTASGQPAVNLLVFCETLFRLVSLKKVWIFYENQSKCHQKQEFRIKKIELESKMTLSSFFFFWSFFAVMLAQCYIAAEQAECSLQYQPNPSISKSSK